MRSTLLYIAFQSWACCTVSSEQVACTASLVMEDHFSDEDTQGYMLCNVPDGETLVFDEVSKSGIIRATAWFRPIYCSLPAAPFYWAPVLTLRSWKWWWPRRFFLSFFFHKIMFPFFHSTLRSTLRIRPSKQKMNFCSKLSLCPDSPQTAQPARSPVAGVLLVFLVKGTQLLTLKKQSGKTITPGGLDRQGCKKADKVF